MLNISCGVELTNQRGIKLDDILFAINANNFLATFTQFFDNNKHDPHLVDLNNYLLNQLLNMRGYNNFHNNIDSGETFFIEQVLAPSNPKLCIDVGANVGDYTTELLDKTGAKVIAFEPLSLAFKKLQTKVAKYDDRVIIENKGVGSKNEILTIKYSPDALAHASFSDAAKKVDYVNNEMNENVNVVTLDSYCDLMNITDIDFIKIDTEGFETEVFGGAVKVFNEIKPKFIQIEFNWHQLFRNTSLYYFSELIPHYEVFQLVPQSWQKVDPKDPMSNLYMYSNFVFVLKK